MRYIVVLVVCTVVLMARNEYDDQTWGTGLVWKNASIPYYNSVVDDSTVINAVPLFYYEDDYFYLHG